MTGGCSAPSERRPAIIQPSRRIGERSSRIVQPSRRIAGCSFPIAGRPSPIFFIAAIESHAAIIAGPITNPANGHEYYLLTPDTWSASEAEAETLGGTLAVIQDDAQQEWVFSKFGDYGGTNRSLWIGLHRNSPGGPFVAVTDTQVNYFNWNAGEPNNAGGNENYVQLYTSGKWNDNSDGANPVCGVAEVPGKSNEKELTAREKSLIGDWYDNGDPNHHCYIVGTGNMLFAIDENRNASRMIDTPEGYLFSPTWKQHVTVLDGRLLWSWGNWWSREPAKFKMAPTAAQKNTGTRPADNQK